MTQSVELGVLCRTTSGGTPSRANPLYFGGDIPWVKSGELNDSTVTKIEERITKRGLENSNAEIFPAGTLLIALYGATVGKLGVLGTPAATNQAVCAIFPDKELDRDFLRFYLLSKRNQLIGQRTGGAQPNISQEIVRKLFVPVPPLSEQQQTAALLEQADRFRRARRYALELSDTFLTAAFLELFGDPKENPRKYTNEYLSDVCLRFSDGPFGSNLKSEHYRPSGVRVIRLNNIGVGQFLDGNQAFISAEHFGTLRKHECLPGDVLIGTLGDPNLRACIQPAEIEVALNKADCIQARINPKKANAQYLCGLLNMPSTLNLVPGMVHGQTRARVSMGELADLPIPIPPFPMQQHFSAIVERHERMRARQREALRQAGHLFQTLLHKAFYQSE